MVDNDAAFLWETEALRNSPRQRELEPPPATESGWVTLRDAHYETGIPVETLRKWARREAVPSSMEETAYGSRRMIRLDAVRARAERLGRPLAPVPEDQRDRHQSTPRPTPAGEVDGEAQHPDQASELDPDIPPPGPPGTKPPPPPAGQPTGTETPQSPEGPELPEGPEGTVLVPIAAWDKMLLQLGNLHEAGQQLAEAKERAAKAETEAKFLRERLREMRRDAPELLVDRPPQPPLEAEPDPGPSEDATEPTETMWRYVMRGWRQRRQLRD